MNKLSAVILISTRDIDVEFAKYLSQKLGLPFVLIKDLDLLIRVFNKMPNSLYLWDVDEPGNLNTSHPCCFHSVFKCFWNLSTPFNQIYALSSSPMNKIHSENSEARVALHSVQNFITRKSNKTSYEVLSRIIGMSLDIDSSGLEALLPAGTKIFRIPIKKVEHKRAAAEAVQTFLIKTGIDSRLSKKTSQAVDELIMNAIFDAPNEGGKETRKLINRKAKFELGEKEKIELELGYSSEYVGILVRDYFGSLDKGLLMTRLQANYELQAYAPKNFEPSAGLGLYGVVQAGLSLILISKSQSFTNAILIFPRAKTFKQFKTGFQIFSSIFSY